MKIKSLIRDLSYEEIKERRWRTPRVWDNKGKKKLLFRDYIMSEDGIVVRVIKINNYFPGKKIKTRKSFFGYEVINFSLNGKRFAGIRFHRLLWETWKGRIPKGLEINHKDGIKTNNSLSNLEVVTHKENMQHANRRGLVNTKEHRKKISESCKRENLSLEVKRRKSEIFRGENHPKSILNQIQVNRIRYLNYIEDWTSLNLVKRFSVSKSTIYSILSGHTWNPSHLTKKELICYYLKSQ